MFLAIAFRLVGFTLGTGLYVFLTVLLARKHGKGPTEKLILAGLVAGTLWHATGAITLFLKASTGAPLSVLSRLHDLAGMNSATLVFVSLAPAVYLAYSVYQYHFLELQISRRIVFAVTLGSVFAVYLLVVKRTAEFMEDEFDAFRAVIELALIFAATLVWLPLYHWMTRFLTQRTQLYADFSKRLIEEAAHILELGPRVQFLAEEVGRSFGLNRCLLVTGTGPRLYGVFGARIDINSISDDLEQAEMLARDDRFELVHITRTKDSVLPKGLRKLGFQYLLPLWYEHRLIGLLLLDVSPRVFLDEGEQILLGLSRQISHSIEACRIIEEKIRLEKTLIEQEHLASLGKVAATIAHEIKNPLSSIKTLVQLMGEDEQVERVYARDLSYITGEIERLNRSVQQLLSFSRPAADSQSEVDLSELLQSTAGVLARQCAAENIRVESRVQPGMTLKRSSPETVKQVVLNLALNAIQASQASGTVRLEAEAQTDGTVRITISDQGPGIPAGLRERIFEPFFTTKQKGTGLGLAIVRKNIRQLRGEIQVESPIENGHGTRVKVTLPAE